MGNRAPHNGTASASGSGWGSEVFTTGQVATICQVAPRTVSKWFDSGRLKGWRIPGSNDRRVPRANLVAFLKEHGLPLGELAERQQTVLAVGVSDRAAASICEQLPAGWQLVQVGDAFEAGIQAEALLPDVVVIDLVIGRSVGLEIARGLRRQSEAWSRAETWPGIVLLPLEDESDLTGLLGLVTRAADRESSRQAAVVAWDAAEAASVGEVVAGMIERQAGGSPKAAIQQPRRRKRLAAGAERAAATAGD